MNCMSFKEKLTQKIADVETILRKYCPTEEGYAKTVLECMNYSVFAGGKRLRPIMMKEAFTALGGRGESIEPFMAAMEMIHTSSLIHDDLPAMDNDTLRRGRPTAWAAYGEDMAILAGDGLLLFAFETAAKALELGADPACCARAMRILASKSGIYGMVGGQSLDVELTGKPVSGPEMDYIYRNKTGALIEASLMIGAVMAGSSDEEIETVRAAALDVGYAFQIQDDILDLTSTEEVLGKPIDSDERNEKTTYVTIHGLEQAHEDVQRLSERAAVALSGLNGDTAFLRELITYLIDRKM